MPYVNIKITDDGVTDEQKKLLIAGVTEILRTTLGKNPKTTMVVIDEVNPSNWGIAGLSVPEFRRQSQQ
jgi:4-oxalocrotonate tautomerase